jgi:hypothetical protein
MTWKPIRAQAVVARLDGRARKVLVTDWESYSGAVKVAWPPQHPSVASRLSTKARRTRLAEDQYEPLDPESFRLATKG